VIFFSTFLYALARSAGADWRKVLAAELERGDESDVPAIRCHAALSRLETVVSSLSGPSRLAWARSTTSGLFLASDADVWVSVDDDATADEMTLRPLLLACRDTRAIVSGPCLQRDPSGALQPNVRFPPRPPEVVQGDGFALARLHATGFGLVAIHRDALQTIADAHPDLRALDSATGQECPALFLERLEGKAWQGEDLSFCHRARTAGVEIFALLDGDVEHAGQTMSLQLVDGELAMRVRT
jgi:hypothetical protein